MKRILFYTHSLTADSSEGYRIAQYFPFLEKRSFIVRIVNTRTSFLKVLREAMKADVVYIQRLLLDPVKFFLLRRVAKRVVYDFDDAIMFGHREESRTRRKRFERTVLKSDIVFAGNRFLASVAKDIRNDHVYYVPTTVDVCSYPRKTIRKNKKPFVVGWMGSKSTLQYLYDLTELFNHYARDQNIVFLVVADHPPGIRSDNLKFLAWEKKKEKQILLNFDLGIMPLKDDLWSKGKCGLKLIQYMATGIPALAHPVGVSLEIIIDNFNGFLRKDLHGWIDVIDKLSSDENLRETVGRAARETVEQKYSLNTWGEKVADIIEGVVKNS